jgi:outer membrane usher protein
LNISVPQIYEDQRLKNYVSPSSGTKGYRAQSWLDGERLEQPYLFGGFDNSSAYLGVNAGLSWDGWLLKHIGNLNWQQQQKAHWNSNQTYLQRPIPQINSIVSGGQILPTASSLTPSACAGLTWRPMTICSRRHALLRP